MVTFRNIGPDVTIAWRVKIKGKQVEQKHTVSTGHLITFDIAAANGQVIATICRDAELVQED